MTAQIDTEVRCLELFAAETKYQDHINFLFHAEGVPNEVRLKKHEGACQASEEISKAWKALTAEDLEHLPKLREKYRSMHP